MSARSAIAPFLAMEVARDASARAAAGRDVVRFDVGQPAYGAPASALAAAERAMRAEPLGYSEALGRWALREGISAWYARRHGVEVDPGRIIITQGASGAFQLAFLSLFDDGDRVAMASPGYPPYRHILTALGFRAAIAEVGLEDRFQLSPRLLDALAEKEPLAGALVASPANPTGTMLSPHGLAALIAAAKRRGLPLIHDEIYHGLVHEDAPGETTALALDPEAIVVNSFSKYWGMTGWRVGWLVAPERLVRPVERLAQNLFISPPAISQVGALAALTAEDETEARRREVSANRRLLLAALPGLKLPVAAPADGAFYLLLDTRAHASDSLSLCRRLLEEADLALTPGVDFCEARGAGWVRLAYARSADEVTKGLERLAAALR